jgi:hypothetical protein
MRFFKCNSDQKEYTFSIFTSVEERENFCKAFANELVNKGVTVK